MLGIWIIAGYLKKRGVKTNYCRKFWQISSTTVGINLYYLPWEVTFFLVVMGSLFLFYAVLSGEGNFFFEAIARESDGPHRGLYVISATYTTLLGFLLASFFFGSFYKLGLLTLGWGDSMGEVIGVKLGKHKYSVPNLTRFKCTRSIEGSLAIFVASVFALIVGLALFTPFSFYDFFPNVILMGIIITCAEAVSPHGMDNLTIPLVTALVATILI